MYKPAKVLTALLIAGGISIGWLTFSYKDQIENKLEKEITNTVNNVTQTIEKELCGYLTKNTNYREFCK